jgi:hypothetical protein
VGFQKHNLPSSRETSVVSLLKVIIYEKFTLLSAKLEQIGWPRGPTTLVTQSSTRELRPNGPAERFFLW